MNPTTCLLRLTAGLCLIACAVEAQPASNAVPPARPVYLRAHRGALSASFTLANDAKIRLGTNSEAVLTDLRAGQTAHVSYTIENGLWLAHEIVVNPPHTKQAGSSTNSPNPNMLHTRGAILAYNASTANLTIRYHR